MPSDILETLLAKGYFPKELPPTFTTETFGQHSRSLIDEWRILKIFKIREDYKTRAKRIKRSAYNYVLAPADIETISTPKRGYERRNIHVTHPIPQAILTYEIEKHWYKLDRWLSRREFTLDEFLVNRQYPRGLKDINFTLHQTRKSYIESTADWLVKTDITRFYPSIYTHSIPWAAYGKARVKADLKVHEGSFADRLDTLVRACNKNQTVGIPIGPETSRLLAEIVSARVDETVGSLEVSFKKDCVDRLQDDWFLGLPTLEKSESALSLISRVYREYGLDINGSKTSIQRMVQHTEDAWRSEMGAFLSHRSGPLYGARLREFLAIVLRLQVQFEQQAVTNYALTVLESHRASSDDVEALESFLLKAAVISPGSMSRICQLLINLEFKTRRLSTKRIAKRFNSLISKNLMNGNIYEVIWQLFTLRGLGEAVYHKDLFSQIPEIQNSTVILIMLDMNSQNLCSQTLPIAKWEQACNKENIISEPLWLMGYEGIRNGWLNDRKNLMNEPFFQSMKKRDVVFYDPRRNVKKVERIVAIRNALRLKNSKEISNLMFQLRGIEDEY